MDKRIYHAALGARFSKKDAQPIGEFIEGIKDATPKHILKEIKANKAHPIAKYIEWDDKKASNAYRLVQVRNIVNHITIEIVQCDRPVRAFHNITCVERSESEYVHIVPVSNDKYMMAQVIENALNELCCWQERYKAYKKLKPISDDLEKSIKKWRVKK